MPPNLKENPKDVFERILCEVSNIWQVMNAEGARKGRAKKNQRSNQDQLCKVKVANFKKAHREL
jgi:hypothetical protein